MANRRLDFGVAFSLLVGKIMCYLLIVYLFTYTYILIHVHVHICIFTSLFFWQDIDEVIKILSSSSLENTLVKKKKKASLLGWENN